MEEIWLTYKQAAEKLGISPEAVRAMARRRGWSRQTLNEVGGTARVLLPIDVDRRSRLGVSDGVTGCDRVSPDGCPTVAIRVDQPGDRPGDRAGELAIEVVVLRERIADKDSVIADLRHRLDAADQRLDEAARESVLHLPDGATAGPANTTDPLTAIGIQTLSQAVEMLREDVDRERERADQAERQVGVERQLVEEGRKRIDELQATLVEERRRIDSLYAELGDARTAAMISGYEGAALRTQLALLTGRVSWWRRWFR